MRIKFTKDVDVDITTVPKEAFGALAIRHAVKRPQFSTEDGLNADGKMIESGTSGHYFRGGWSTNIPDEIGQRYIDAGQAEQIDRVVKFVDSLEEMPE